MTLLDERVERFLAGLPPCGPGESAVPGQYGHQELPACLSPDNGEQTKHLVTQTQSEVRNEVGARSIPGRLRWGAATFALAAGMAWVTFTLILQGFRAVARELSAADQLSGVSLQKLAVFFDSSIQALIDALWTAVLVFVILAAGLCLLSLKPLNEPPASLRMPQITDN